MLFYLAPISISAAPLLPLAPLAEVAEPLEAACLPSATEAFHEIVEALASVSAAPF